MFAVFPFFLLCLAVFFFYCYSQHYYFSFVLRHYEAASRMAKWEVASVRAARAITAFSKHSGDLWKHLYWFLVGISSSFGNLYIGLLIFGLLILDCTKSLLLSQRDAKAIPESENYPGNPKSTLSLLLCWWHIYFQKNHAWSLMKLECLTKFKFYCRKLPLTPLKN